MKVRRFRSFRFKIIMYMLLSVIATLVTEGIIFAGIYLYEREIVAGDYRRIWGSGTFSLLRFGEPSRAFSDLGLIIVFSMILMTLYFILISHGFVMYVREIINGVEKMKAGDLMEEIPVRGEDEFSEIAGSINEMRRNLYETLEADKEVERTKDELITNVAHDLRTPLTSILGYLDLLSEGDFLTDEQRQKYLGIVSAKARQIEKLIRDLFDYTRYDKNKVKVKKEILDLNLFVPQLVDEFYPSFMENDLECRTEFCEGALNIEANGELLARAIGNLLSNAVKYGADGKVVEVRTRRGDTDAFVSVTNYGKLISPEQLEKIFEKFYRVESSRSLKTGGTGLGLAIAKNIINLHDGEIRARSDENGTVFEISLPLIKGRRS
ncbi:MAG: HAMP domain-containing histidine kinase [Eubacterium sp.]|nr:HAMP domain-containing histidine kinase [Eubacterium sp.]